MATKASRRRRAAPGLSVLARAFRATELAKAVGVSRQQVHLWRQLGSVPPHRVRTIRALVRQRIAQLRALKERALADPNGCLDMAVDLLRPKDIAHVMGAARLWPQRWNLDGVPDGFARAVIALADERMSELQQITGCTLCPEVFDEMHQEE